MSMTVLTILQAVTVFLLYTVMTCALPFALLNRKLIGFRLVEKLMLSFVSGNFYIINLVFILQLLHISNRWILVLGTVIPFFAAMVITRKFNLKGYLKELVNNIKKVLSGELGIRSVIFRFTTWLWNVIRTFVMKCFKAIIRNPIDTVLFVAVTVLITWIYGENLVEHLGYCASDIPVHNYWINYMSRDELFVAGVYPFGFHCMIYYLHEVFGVATYIFLRVFCFIQTLYIHWMLLFFLKAALKSKYLAYIGTAVYAASSLFQYNTYSRFGSSLPQEFGMIFILPAIYFGFAFFKNQKKELDIKAKWCLAGFAMNFSLTLAVHFYDTMVAGLFCVAMAVGFAFRFFRKKYFGKVVLTCLISVVIAVLPMGIAFATGTPLQGSLGWGMGVLTGEDSKEEESDETVTDTANESSADTDEQVDDSTAVDTKTDTAANADTEAVSDLDIAEGNKEKDIKSKAMELYHKLLSKLKTVLSTVESYLYTNIINIDEPIVILSIFGSIVLLLGLSLVYFIARQPDYGARLVTVSLYMIIMSLLLIAGPLGLPRLMDVNRTSIYYSYSLPVLWCFAIDALLALVFGWTKRKWILNMVSLIAVGLIGNFFWSGNYIRSQVKPGALQTNDAITCTTNILRDYEDFTWTILSANDELRMTEDYGYHYETITFLKEIEPAGRHKEITIPTEYVFVYIEKIPIDYTVKYENSGQSISEEGAKQSIPRGGGIKPYQGENRWICMSRMYYWAEAFREMYPEDMTVYYETDEFICYRLKQNVFSLYELGIDYGYNMSSIR